MLYVAFDFTGDRNNFKNVICFDDNGVVVFESNEDYDALREEIREPLNCCLLSLTDYFESLNSCNYYRFGKIEIEIQTAIDRILNNNGLLERYITNSDGYTECVSSYLQYLINEEITIIIKEEIEKMETLYQNIGTNNMKWN